MRVVYASPASPCVTSVTIVSVTSINNRSTLILNNPGIFGIIGYICPIYSMEESLRSESGRDTKGRFVPGNRIANADNNPLCRQVYDLKRVFLSVCSPDQMEQITHKLLALCRDKDAKIALQAIDLTLSRVFGKPKETIEVDGTPVARFPADSYSEDQLRQVVAILAKPDLDKAS